VEKRKKKGGKTATAAAHTVPVEPEKAGEKEEATSPEILTTEEYEHHETLKAALRSGNARVVKELTQTSNVNDILEDGMTALHYFCSVSGGYESTASLLKVFQVLLDNGANINQTNPKKMTRWNEPYRPILYTIDQGSVELVKTLFKNGANVEAIDVLLSDVVLHASRARVADLARVLLDNGANPNFNRSVEDHAFILLDAVKRDDRHLVRVLLQAGADPTVKGAGKRTALHEACRRGNVGIIKALLEKGIDVNPKATPADAPIGTDPKNIPLFDLIEYGTSCGKREITDLSEAVEIANLLVERGADVNAVGLVPWDWNKTSPKGFIEATVLEYANRLNASALVKVFLKGGAKISRNPPYKTFTFYTKEDYQAFKKWWDQYLQSKKQE